MILEHVTLRDFCLFRGEQTFDLTPCPRRGTRARGRSSCSAASTAPARRRCSTRSSSRSTARARVARSGPTWRTTSSSASRSTTVSSESEGAGGLALRSATPPAVKSTSTTSVDPGTCRAARCARSCACSRMAALDRWHSEHWNQLVEDFFPLEVSQLFFFDAEKIRSLAEDETSSQVLGTAVKSLLGPRRRRAADRRRRRRRSQAERRSWRPPSRAMTAPTSSRGSSSSGPSWMG